MEYIIIIVLLIFLVTVILKKQINFAKDINFINEKKIIKYNRYYLLNTNPILIYLYENLYKSLKQFNKYDYNKYIVFNSQNISDSDKSILDWCAFTGGMIRMALDSSVKHLKKKNDINTHFVDDLARLKLFYKIFCYDKTHKIDNPNKIDKQLKKYNKSIRNNRVIYNLLCINNILNSIFIEIVDSINNSDNKKTLGLLKKTYNKPLDDYYLFNLILTNKDNKENKENKRNKRNEIHKHTYKPSLFSTYIEKIL